MHSWEMAKASLFSIQPDTTAVISWNLERVHADALKDAEGELYPVQKTAEGAVVYVRASAVKRI